MANAVARDLNVVPRKPEATPEPVQAEWTCALSRLDEKTGTPNGDLAEPITVGTLFHVACSGSPVELRAASLSLDVPAEGAYALRVLEVRDLSTERTEMIATSWTAGEIDLQGLVLTDGAQRVGLSGVKFTVETVIDQQSNPEMKPAPPWMPIELGWPVYVWGILLALLLMALGSLLLALRDAQAKRKLKKLLAQNPIALTPYNHFNKELRRINRTLPSKSEAWSLEDSKIYFNELNIALRWLLARELFVMAIGTKPRTILRSIKKADKELHQILKKDLYLALTEMQKAMEAKTAPTLEDASQISDLCRQIANSMARKIEERRMSGRKKS